MDKIKNTIYEKNLKVKSLEEKRGRYGYVKFMENSNVVREVLTAKVTKK